MKAKQTEINWERRHLPSHWNNHLFINVARPGITVMWTLANANYDTEYYTLENENSENVGAYAVANYCYEFGVEFHELFLCVFVNYFCVFCLLVFFHDWEKCLVAVDTY